MLKRDAELLQHLQNAAAEAQLAVHHGLFDGEQGEVLMARDTGDGAGGFAVLRIEHDHGARRSGVIGIADVNAPDFGDAVTIRPGEVPVFWPCGVTPQAALMASKPAFAITHAPGHMLVTDVKNIDLKY